MSYYEQYVAVRNNPPNDYAQMVVKMPILIGAALDLAEGVARYPNAKVYNLDNTHGTYAQVSLEAGVFTVESNCDPLVERPHTVTTALASWALDGQYYNVIQNRFSERPSGTRLASYLFHILDISDAQELCRERGFKEVLTGYRLFGAVLRKGEVLTTPVAPLTQDDVYQVNLLPSERYIRPFSKHRIVNHRLQSTIDLMAGFAGLRE